MLAERHSLKIIEFYENKRKQLNLAFISLLPEMLLSPAQERWLLEVTGSVSPGLLTPPPHFS